MTRSRPHCISLTLNLRLGREEEQISPAIAAAYSALLVNRLPTRICQLLKCVVVPVIGKKAVPAILQPADDESYAWLAVAVVLNSVSLSIL